jgi:[pyruvate, water dikinase]-phosphate phosphotransferase / [pyruvate, water dikinase] kinase
MLTIFVVSDSTGETAERVARSALTQFEDAPVTIERRGGVRTAEQVQGVIAEAAGRDSLVLHTLVRDELRRLMLAEARKRGVDAMDLMGPVLDRLANQLGLTPSEKPGLFGQLLTERARQIDAVDFAFRHDDGQRLGELDRAEVVLVGVSRTMKTPTMVYLAYRGWFAANVPLVPGVPPPRELLALPPERVFGLFMTPARLAELRRVRASHLRLATSDYTSLADIREELLRAQILCIDHGWQRIDVTGKSVEEVALEILTLGHLVESPQSVAE